MSLLRTNRVAAKTLKGTMPRASSLYASDLWLANSRFVWMMAGFSGAEEQGSRGA
jgi:hypothetical protein